MQNDNAFLEKAAKYICTSLGGLCPMSAEDYTCPTVCDLETVPWVCWLLYLRDPATGTTATPACRENRHQTKRLAGRG